MIGKKIYLRSLKSFKTKPEIQKYAKKHRTKLNNYATIDKNKGGWFVWLRAKSKSVPKIKSKQKDKNYKSQIRGKKLNIHPYNEFGFKPKKISLNRTYLYHATNKKEIYNIEPPVFVATEPKIAKKIVNMVHGSKDSKVLKINVKGLPVYKDLYWENDDKQYKNNYSKFPEPAVMFMLRDMELPLRKISKNKIYYIPKKIIHKRIKVMDKKNKK